MNKDIPSEPHIELPIQNSASDTSNWDDKAFTTPSPKVPVVMFNMNVVEERPNTVPWNKLPDLAGTDNDGE